MDTPMTPREKAKDELAFIQRERAAKRLVEASRRSNGQALLSLEEAYQLLAATPPMRPENPVIKELAMSTYIPSANDLGAKDFRAKATVEAAYHIGEKTLMAAFTGNNHHELARQFGLAIADVYCIIRAHQYRQLARAIAEAPLPGADSSVEVLWECHAETLANPLQTEGLLRAVRMATEQAGPDRPLDLQIVLVARRSPVPQAAQPNTPAPAEAAPAESQPGIPSRGDSPAAP